MQKKINRNTNTQNTSWGKVADWYDDLLEKDNDSYQEKVILPNLLRLIGDCKKKKILDIACGQGYFSRHLASSGANVVGIDIGKELIDIAKKNSDKRIKYFVSRAENIEEALVGKDFEIAVNILAIQNIQDIQKMMKSVWRVMVPGARLIIVMNHPSFRIPKSSSWQWDDSKQKQYRRIESYMNEKKISIDMHPGSREKVETITFHRPLQSYFKALRSAGFVVTRLEEWISHKVSQKGPRSIEEDRIRKEIPLFMMIEAVKM